MLCVLAQIEHVVYPIKRQAKDTIAELLTFLQVHTKGSVFVERPDDIDAEIASIVRSQPRDAPTAPINPVTPVAAVSAQASRAEEKKSAESKSTDVDSENKHIDATPSSATDDYDPFDTNALQARMADLMKAAGVGKR